MARRKKILDFIIGIIIGICFSQLAKRGEEMCSPRILDKLQIEDDKQNTEESLLFVGVMTASKYLNTRAKAAYETWGLNLPGKIAFFSSEDSRSNEIPLVPLIGVDDSYPPQKKSFAMLRYMHDNYLDKFEWFMRADDDVYVRTNKLEALLRSVDSRKPWFIGQTGRGNSEEFGLLSLESDENFCMGGPGIILSRETLRRIGPHIEECLENLYTTHEDVELGRCVKKMAGVSCTWSYEASDFTSQMQVILYHNQSGRASFTGDLKQKEIHKAITLHPIKEPKYMYRLHKYVKGLSVQFDKQEAIRLHRDIATSMLQLGVDLDALQRANLFQDVKIFQEEPGSDLYLEDPKVLGVEKGLNRFKPDSLTDLLDWEFISKSWYSYKDLNPKRRLGSATKEGLSDVIREVMEIINLYSKQRGRIIDFKEIYYGYWRLDPVHGVDLILDLLLLYRKYRGHKMTVPVRRHAYIQQTFTGIMVREVTDNDSQSQVTTEVPLHRKLIHQVIHNIPTIFTLNSSSVNGKERVTFVLPVSGRLETLRRFLALYEELCILEEENTRLIVLLYKSDEFPASLNLLNKLRERHKTEIIVEVVDEVFSRGRALQQGVDVSAPNDLLFFIDVDIVFNRESLVRIRQNTQRNKTVYFPIVYSLYKPANGSVEYTISEDKAAWRQFGFGIVSLYKSDYNILGGINTTISGWGFEDVAFYEAAVKSHLRVQRSTDAGLVHVYHPVICDSNLDAVQMHMCRGSQASTYAPLRHLQREYKRLFGL